MKRDDPTEPVGPMLSPFHGLALIALLLVTSWAIPAGAASPRSHSDPPPAARAPRENPGDSAGSRSLLVKYRSRGEHALLECAERLTTRGERFEAHTADRDPSIDRLHERFGLGRHEAVFRRTVGPDFRAERRRLASRLERARSTRRGAGRDAGASRDLPDLSHVYRLVVPPGEDVDAVADALRADLHVEYAQPDYALALDQLAPAFDDPYLESSGAWGQPYPDLWGLDQIGAREVWGQTQGEGIVVAVVDTGLDRFHPDIADNVWVNPGEDLNGDGRAGPEDLNGLDDDGNGFIDDLTGFDFAASIDADEDGFFDGPEDISDSDPFDEIGHGTHVAGTIAAVANNGQGIVGVAPRARIMALKAFPVDGAAETSVLWRAVLYAAVQGASVVNNSWSCDERCPSNPLAEDVLAHVEALGTVVVTSAGNSSEDVVFRSPENTDLVITVGALGFDERLADFSSRGWGVDLVAPGGGPRNAPGVAAAHRNILSLLTSALAPEEVNFSVGDRYLRFAGTSTSAPHVTGAVALLRSLRPELLPSEVRRLIRISGRDHGLPGHDPTYGVGGLDLPRLLSGTLPDLVLAIEGPVSASVHDPAAGPIEIVGLAGGRDLASFSIDVAAGLAGRDFRPLESFVGSKIVPRDAKAPARVTAYWDLEEVADGPHVVRYRALLFDGSHVDEHVVIAVERATPFELTEDERAVGEPAISGRNVVWPMAESDEPAAESDLALGFLPRGDGGMRKRGPRHGRPLARSLEVEGSPRDVALDRSIAVWRIRDGGDGHLAWCRLAKRRAFKNANRRARSRIPGRGSRIDCEERSINLPPGTVSKPWAGSGWVVWQRDHGQERAIEGCQLGSGQTDCVPRALVATEGEPRWSMRSFDGRTLLLQAPGQLALCRLSDDDTTCEPEPIEMAPGTSRSPIEPIHDGNLLVFDSVTIAVKPPTGCLPGEFIPECAPTFAIEVQHHACWLDEQERRCESIPISVPVRVERTGGIAVSGRRIVWSQASPLEEISIRFCEFQSATRECFEQRLSGSLAEQDAPTIAAARVAWRGSRTSAPSIFGYELPDLSGPARRAVWAGRPFSISLHANPGTARTLRYDVESLDAGSPGDSTAAKLWVEDRGRPGGRIRLRGVFNPNALGLHRVRLRATAESGLYSESIVELKVRPMPNVEERRNRWTRRVPRRSGRDSGKVRKPGR